MKNVQSVLFQKNLNTKRDAETFLRKHNFIINRDTPNFDTTHFYRYRQFDPDENKYTYRMYLVNPSKNIYFVLEYPREY